MDGAEDKAAELRRRFRLDGPTAAERANEREDPAVVELANGYLGLSQRFALGYDLAGCIELARSALGARSSGGQTDAGDTAGDTP